MVAEVAVIAALIQVSVAYANGGQVTLLSFSVVAASPISAVLRLARIELLEGSAVSVWGKAKALNEPLREGDRIEVCAALRCDPKEARRLRYAQKKQREKEAN